MSARMSVTHVCTHISHTQIVRNVYTLQVLLDHSVFVPGFNMRAVAKRLKGPLGTPSQDGSARGGGGLL